MHGARSRGARRRLPRVPPAGDLHDADPAQSHGGGDAGRAPPGRGRGRARRHGIVVLEDDVYGFLLDDRPPSDPQPSFPSSASTSPACRSRWHPGCGSATSPPPPPLVTRLAAAVRTSVLMTSSVAAHIASRGDPQRRRRRSPPDAQRQEARARQRLAADLLDGLDFRTHPSAFHGWLAVPAPWRRDDFIAALVARGVSVTPGSAFAGAAASREAARRTSACACAPSPSANGWPRRWASLPKSRRRGAGADAGGLTPNPWESVAGAGTTNGRWCGAWFERAVAVAEAGGGADRLQDVGAGAGRRRCARPAPGPARRRWPRPGCSRCRGCAACRCAGSRR